MEKQINDSEKLNNKEIDYSLYSSEPEKLITLSQEQINNNNFTLAIVIIKTAIDFAIKKYGGDDKIQLANFYNKYADYLLQKISSASDNTISIKSDQEEENKNYLNIDLIYEYLYKANEILQNYLDEYNNKNIAELNKDIIEYYLQLSDNYYLLALYEKEMLNYKRLSNFII